MAIRSNNDQFARTFGQDNDPRFKNWLAHTLSLQGWRPPEGGGTSNSMVDWVLHNRVSTKQLKEDYKKAAVPKEMLEWVKNDPWQQQWLCIQLPTQLFVTPYIKGRDLSVLRIDQYIPNPTQTKVEFVEALKRSWLIQTRHDKKYAWFLGEGAEAKRSMLLDWIEKNPSTVSYPVPYGWRPSEYSEVLEFFYPRGNFTANDAKLCFDSVKKRWNQVQYRDGLKAKKKQQCNIVLAEKSLKKLDAMADRYMLSRAKILEVLIRFESDQKRYLPVWEKMAQSED